MRYPEALAPFWESMQMRIPLALVSLTLLENGKMHYLGARGLFLVNEKMRSLLVLVSLALLEK